jgi:prevent-host-death family protein
MYTNVQNRDTPEQPMKQVSFTEFRRNAASLFDSVEQGETIVVLRHGKPIAEVVPVLPPDHILSWKRPGIRLAAARGLSLSKEILKERRSGLR